ncbi:CHAP domain-containing protein [Rhizobium ruizarguesonis]|uniref:CHAP domain-containing protein n=1 Tax=Rhizobium ruizarguesonis TaxID=2081791 RepID=UPI0013EE98A0|nr:CHAP domain-containing protein [Rhizobium ruizarguesonis]
MIRRDFILAAAGISISTLFSSVSVGQDDFQVVEPDFSEGPPAEFPEGIRVPTAEEYDKQLEALTGAQNPYKPEIELGRTLIKEDPVLQSRNKSPFEIADRFREWRQGLVGDSGERKRQYSYYAREWPVRGNPIIMGFFDATGYRTPAGDTTWWCSAFVCACVQRSLESKGIRSREWPYASGAASSSYRQWGKDVITDLNSEPRKGDLAVFQNTRTSYQGHVGFVHSVVGNQIMVLGGNQGAQNEYNGGEVNIAPFDLVGSGRLRFLSFRRHDSLS